MDHTIVEGRERDLFLLGSDKGPSEEDLSVVQLSDGGRSCPVRWQLNFHQSYVSRLAFPKAGVLQERVSCEWNHFQPWDLLLPSPIISPKSPYSSSPLPSPSLRFNFQNILTLYLRKYQSVILVWTDWIGDLENIFVCSVEKMPEFNPWAWVAHDGVYLRQGLRWGHLAPPLAK